MSTLVVYASKTGNTEKVARRIYDAVSDPDKTLVSLSDYDHRCTADTVYVGFWNNRGTCCVEVMDLLSELSGKRIALFGTCGMGDLGGYYDAVRGAVSAWIPEDSEYLGCFLCQGKMPFSIRDRYESMRDRTNYEKVDALIDNFEEALLHPDEEDLKRAEEFVIQIESAAHPAG